MAKATDTEVYQLLSEWQIPYERVDHQAVFTVAEIDFSIDGSEVKNLLMRGKKSKQNYLSEPETLGYKSIGKRSW